MAAILDSTAGVSFKKTIRISRPVKPSITRELRDLDLRSDVRIVNLTINGNKTTGYTMRGGESTYVSLVDQAGKIVGWEHSYCHQPVALVFNKAGALEKMTDDARAKLQYGTIYRAIWEKAEPDEFNPKAVPAGNIIAFIPAAKIR